MGSGEVRLLRRDVARIGKAGCRVEWLARRGLCGEVMLGKFGFVQAGEVGYGR